MLKRFAFLIILLTSTFLLSTSVFASESVVVSGVSVEATLNEDRTIDVTETYTAYIYDSVENITMTLPLTQTITRQTAAGVEELTYNVEYSGIELYDRHVSTTVDGDTLIITTQGAGFEEGAVQIPLVYTYDPGTDNTIGADEIFFRPVRGGRSTSMGSFSFTFNFPAEIAAENVSLTTTAGESVVEHSLDGTVLTGYNLASIPPEHDVTLQATMQDGYFIGGLSTDDSTPEFSFDNLIYGICSAVLGLVLLLNILIRIRGRVKPQPTTHPPEDFSPAELYHLLRKEPSRRSVLSSLISLAIKGYVTISFDETGLLITKKQNSDDNLPILQQELILSAFSDCENFLLDKDKLLAMTSDFSKSAQRSLGRSTELENNITFGLGISMILLLGVCSGIIIGYFYGIDTGMTRMLMVATSVGLPFAIGGLMLRSGFSAMRQKKPAIMLFIGFAIIIFALCWGIMATIYSSDNIIGITFMALATVLLIATAASYRKSSYALDIISQTEALNRFIVSPQADRLKTLVEKEPEYLLTVLPHAVCFGNEQQLIKNFEHCELPIVQTDRLPPIKELCDLLPGNS